MNAIFALVAEAYDVLSDPLKRTIYDQFGEEGLKNGVPGAEEFIQPYIYHGEPMRTYKYFNQIIALIFIYIYKVLILSFCICSLHVFTLEFCHRLIINPLLYPTT